MADQSSTAILHHSIQQGLHIAEALRALTTFPSADLTDQDEEYVFEALQECGVSAELAQSLFLGDEDFETLYRTEVEKALNRFNSCTRSNSKPVFETKAPGGFYVLQPTPSKQQQLQGSKMPRGAKKPNPDTLFATPPAFNASVLNDPSSPFA